jgi:hypothetical protein
VLADLLGSEALGELLEGAAVLVVLGDDAAHRVDDLTTAAVADCEIDVEPGVVLRAFLGIDEHTGELRRQQSGAAHVLDAPVALVRELIGQLRDDLDEVCQLSRVALDEVVVGEQVQRHHAHADLVAPFEELAHLRRTCAVSVRRRLVAELTRPAPVAVDHHGDVPRHCGGGEPAAKPIDVQAVERAPACL